MSLAKCSLLAKRSSLEKPRSALLLFLAALPVASCDAIVGAGDRKLDTSIVCGSGGCECAIGFGDCDDDPDNGCEADLNDPKNCGACGNTCDNGTCENLACACEPGFAECDGDPATVCETDVFTDSAHCGSCTRDCGGAACDDTLCEPEQISAAGAVYNFTLVGKEMYFAPDTSPGIWHVDIDGGNPTQLDGGMNYAYLLVHDAGKIYWSNETSIFVTDIATGLTDTLATGQIPGLRIAVGGGKVYWGDIAMATNVVSIHRTTTTPGGTVENIATLLDVKFVNDFAVTADRVFWNDIDTILSTTHDTLSPSPFQSVPLAPAYFDPSPKALLFTGVPGGTFELPLEGGSATKVADIEGYGWLTSDADHVFFMTYAYGQQGPPVLWRSAHDGSEPTIALAEDAFMLPYLPLSLDDTFIYWLNTQSKIVVRVRK